VTLTSLPVGSSPAESPSVDRTGDRHLFIVTQSDPAIYCSLARFLAGDSDARVIFDRRAAAHDGPGSASICFRGSAGPFGERRARPQVDEEIRVRGWAYVDLRASALHPRVALPLEVTRGHGERRWAFFTLRRRGGVQ
jgi:hypothetical protein